MTILRFKTSNGQDTAEYLTMLTASTSDVVGDLESHGGQMGVIRNKTGGPLSWWVLLAKRSDLSGEAVLKLEYDTALPPNPAIMKTIFEMLDQDTVLAELVDHHNYEDYPDWIEN